MEQPTLHTERLTLRPAARQDAAAIVDYYTRNREHLRPWDPKHPPAFFTKEYWNHRIDQNHDEFQMGLSCRFFFFHRDNPHRVIGHASFSQIVRGSFQACYLGYTIDEECEGKGLMFEGLTEAIRYMFEVQNMHRIMANYLPHNVRSGRLLRRLGFTVEGFARDYLMINGRWEDHVMTSLTNVNWREG